MAITFETMSKLVAIRTMASDLGNLIDELNIATHNGPEGEQIGSVLNTIDRETYGVVCLIDEAMGVVNEEELEHSATA